MNNDPVIDQAVDAHTKRVEEGVDFLKKNHHALATFTALVEEGPLWAGDLPSKHGRDQLVDAKLCVGVIVKGESGYYAATPICESIYIKYFGDVENIREAIKYRKAKRP